MKSNFSRLFIVIFIFLSVKQIQGQKVGVVLSGGGASAAAHVGFLKALEDHNIPIHCIAGSSMGAVIGAMYASGLSVHQIDSVTRSREYFQMASGAIDDELRYYFMENEVDASMATLKFGGKSVISTTLPTNLINPVLMDYKLMEGFAQASAAANYLFDSLFIPFRCVASDIESKESVMFDRGHVNVAVRASATYPFYLHPIRVDGKLLYDGGLYNNFPSNVLYDEFIPDVILGSNVSGNIDPPDEEDLLSQLANMIRAHTNFETLCEQMVIVEPVMSIGTFDFGQIHNAINVGYEATVLRMDEIKSFIQDFETPEALRAKRRDFLKKMHPLIIDEVQITGLDRSQKSYLNRVMGSREDTISLSRLKPNYFRVFSDEKIKSIFPVASYKPETGYYSLALDVKREKDVSLSVGGNFSSKPINTGFVGIRYNVFTKTPLQLEANSYFGKFYGSVHANVKLDVAGKLPFSVRPGFTFNRWDFFKSRATFFEDVRPSFVVKNERFAGLKFMFPAGSRGQVNLDVNYAHIFDDYYLTEDFLASDTADQTVFDAGIAQLSFDRNTLNRKQWANQGSRLQIRLKYVTGEERSLPGSTSAIRDTTGTFIDWGAATLSYTNYFAKLGKLKLGFLLEGTASNQPFFSNYIATLIHTPSFDPIPESTTLFLNEFRAHNYAAGGLIGVFSIGKNFDLRGEGYVFNPIGQIVQDADNRAQYDWNIEQFYQGSASVIYHSPIGPMSMSVNYFDMRREPWSFIFTFGYTIFNESVRD